MFTVSPNLDSPNLKSISCKTTRTAKVTDLRQNFSYANIDRISVEKSNKIFEPDIIIN